MWKDSHYETDEIFEIWDGEKVMMRPSSPKHESVLGAIFLIVKSFVIEQRLGAVYLSNTAVYLNGEASGKDFVMPDLTFVSVENKRIVKQNGIYGAPDLVIEVVSPGLSNTRRDLVDKYRKYEQAGVTEYWLVDPIDQKIEIHRLQQGKYVQSEQSEVLKGIVLAENLIFSDDFGDDA